MRAIAVRPGLQFAVVAAFVVAAESAVLASRGFSLHPVPLRLAVIFDLCTALPLGYWLLVVRRGLARPRTVARVAVLAIALCAAIFGREVRLLAVPLELALLWVAVASVRRALRTRTSPDAATALRLGLSEALGDNTPARAVATEFSVLWYALCSWGRTAPAGFTADQRAGWIAIYFAVGIAIFAEGIPLHFLLPRGWAIASAALHLYTALWLVGDLRALVLRPITVEDGVLHLRIGLRWEADLPLDEIVGAEISQRVEGCRMGVIGSPNLILRLRHPAELHGPYGIRRTAQALSLQVDDPQGLRRALTANL